MRLTPKLPASERWPQDRSVGRAEVPAVLPLQHLTTALFRFRLTLRQGNAGC